MFYVWLGACTNIDRALQIKLSIHMPQKHPSKVSWLRFQSALKRLGYVSELANTVTWYHTSFIEQDFTLYALRTPSAFVLESFDNVLEAS